ncbi:MAG: hypothetical protein AAGF12_02300 [Myxococcota bacterium]
MRVWCSPIHAALFAVLLLGCPDDADGEGSAPEPVQSEPEPDLEESLAGSEQGAASGETDEGAEETSEPFSGRSTLATLNPAFFAPVTTELDGFATHTQPAGCPDQGPNFDLEGFSLMYPEGWAVETCDGHNYATLTDMPDDQIVQRVGLGGMRGAVNAQTLRMVGRGLLAAAFPEGSTFGEATPGTEVLHGSELPRQDSVITVSGDGELGGEYVVRLLPIARPFTVDASGTLGMTPNGPGVVILAFRRMEGSREETLEALETELAPIVDSFRFALPEGHSPPPTRP